MKRIRYSLNGNPPLRSLRLLGGLSVESLKRKTTKNTKETQSA